MSDTGDNVAPSSKIVRRPKVRCKFAQWVPLSDLKPHPKNRNKHPKSQVKRLAEILKYQGIRRPIRVSNLSGFITVGHGQRLAMIEAGWDEAPVDFQDYDSAEQEYADIQADNAIALWATLDIKSIKMELPDMPNLDAEMLGLENLGASEKEKKEDGALPSAPENPITQPGDIWVLGKHRLLCGDAAARSNLGRLMEGALADLVFTSPPYNQKLDSFKPSGMQKASPNWVNKMGSAYFDSMPEDDYQASQINLIDLIFDFTADKASFFYNHKHRYRDKVALSPLEWLLKTKWKIRQEIIWDRAGSVTLNARMFMPVDERVYWMAKGDFFFNEEFKSLGTVWKIPPVNEVKNVSAPFPNELPSRGIDACSAKGSLVLDPYLGTGTTLIVCEQKERQCYGTEINPSYCDVIVKRWEDFTGKKAHRQSA